MAYERALEAAGAVVHAFKEFGSYQGEWYALVTYNGERGWVSGGYGSCSGCDAFEGEFGWDDDEFCNQHSYDAQESCEGCQLAKAKYRAKLADFGRTYLDGVLPADTILAGLDENKSWDGEAEEAAAWIRATV